MRNESIAIGAGEVDESQYRLRSLEASGSAGILACSAWREKRQAGMPALPGQRQDKRSRRLRASLIEGITIATCVLISGCHPAPNKETPILTKIDHLVFATPDLAAGVAQVERLLGVSAVPGGQHPGWGTRNALIGLGDNTYLEIIGSDPDQPKPDRPRRFGIDELRAPRLVTWAAKGADLEAIVENAKSQGLDLGQVQAGSRRRPDGVLLSWRLTVSPALNEGGIVPFFIDWRETPQPAASLPKGCLLVALRAEHPDASRVQTELSVLGLNVRVDSGSAPAIIATIRTPNGEVELR